MQTHTSQNYPVRGAMKLVFILYTVGHWLRAAGFGECKFSAFPGLPK